MQDQQSALLQLMDTWGRRCLVREALTSGEIYYLDRKEKMIVSAEVSVNLSPGLEKGEEAEQPGGNDNKPKCLN